MDEVKELDSIYIKQKLSVDEIKQFLKNQNSFIFDNEKLYLESSKNNTMFKPFQSKEVIEAYSLVGSYYNSIYLIDDDLKLNTAKLHSINRVNYYITELLNFSKKIPKNQKFKTFHEFLNAIKPYNFFEEDVASISFSVIIVL